MTLSIQIIRDLVIIFGSSAVLVFILNRLRVPSIVGYLFAGLLLGPYGLGVVSDVTNVEFLAELGVILLLFNIGLELSIRDLLNADKETFAGGSLLILATIGTVAIFALWSGLDARIALFSGMVVATNSTSIAIKTLLDRAETDTPIGQMTIWIQIFGDLCVIPFMLLVPLLAGQGEVGAGGIAVSFAKALLIIVVIFLASRWAIPRVLEYIVAAKSREMFIISVITICFGTAMLTFYSGLPLTLGAFIAGLVISESEYATQTISDMIPMMESFVALFFVSVGMLINLDFFTGNFALIAGLALMVIVVKIIINGASLLISRLSLAHVLRTSFYVAQIGEFSFVLAFSALTYGLISRDIYQMLLSVSFMTLVLSPLMVRISVPVSKWAEKWGRFGRLSALKADEDKGSMSGHVIIIGFGVNGRNLARVLKSSGIPYVILELNSSTVASARKAGEPAFFGDGTTPEVLRRMGISGARVLVITIHDASAARRIVQVAKIENRNLRVIVRSRLLHEVAELHNLGADDVIPEEFETSIEIFARVLRQYLLPKEEIEGIIADVRADTYGVLRSLPADAVACPDIQTCLPELEVTSWRLSEDSPLRGRKLAETHMRKEFGVNVMAVARGSEIIYNPDPEYLFGPGDILFLAGRPGDIARLKSRLLEPVP